MIASRTVKSWCAVPQDKSGFLGKIFILLILIELLGTGALEGAAIGDFSDPEWYDQAKNKILVLEYNSPDNKQWGRQLSQLIGNMTLGTLNGVSSAAIIILRQEDIRLELNDNTIGTLADTQRPPVVVWGEYYAQNGRNYLYSHISFLPEVDPDKLGMTLQIDLDPEKFSGRETATAILPTRQINFAPIEVSNEILEELETTWESTFRLLKEAKEGAEQTGELVPKRQYYVMETQGSWTKFLVRGYGEGWVQIGNVFARPEIQELNGLVLYAQGLLQYTSRNFLTGKKSFEEYLTKYASRQDAMNKGMAEILLGYCHYYDETTPWSERLESAKSAFTKASELIPNNSSPLNCLALMTFHEVMTGVNPAGGIKTLEHGLIQAIQNENDIYAVRNLKLLYNLPEAASFYNVDQTTYTQRKEQRITLLNTLESTFLKDQTNRSVVELKK